MGDAAHAMYPTGSNGASQAIIDARVLGAAMVQHGVTREALAAFDRKMCGPISELVLRNRGAGPFGLLNLVDERCGGQFDDIDAVVPAAERDGVHGPVQGRGGLCDRAAQRGGADDCGRGRRRGSRSTPMRRAAPRSDAAANRIVIGRLVRC